MDHDDRYIPVSRSYQQRYARRYSDHAFDKLRSVDITLAEFVTMLNDIRSQPEVIAMAHESDTSVKELVLLVQWIPSGRPTSEGDADAMQQLPQRRSL